MENQTLYDNYFIVVEYNAYDITIIKCNAYD